MFILITVTILLITALVLLVLQIAAPNFRYNWLIATGGALLGWISVFVWQAQMPFALQFPAWKPEILFSQSPTFVADGVAWTFAVSLATLCLAIILTAVVRSNFPRPINWMGTLILTLLGILAVLADNPLTLVLIWAAIDISELIAQMRVVKEPALSERTVIAFASRAAGTFVLLWADMVSLANGQALDFRSAPPQAGLYLVLAAGLRIGVLPLHLPYSEESSLRRGFGTGLRMISAASRFSRSLSSPAARASSSDCLIRSCRLWSAVRSGRHAYLVSSVSSTRNVRIVQMKSPGSGRTSGFNAISFFYSAGPTLLEEHHEQHEHFGQNRHAFEQEQRQVHGGGDSVRRAGLPCHPVGRRRRQPADSQTRADHDQTKPERRSEIMYKLHSLPPFNPS